jgi:hypothetical protein
MAGLVPAIHEHRVAGARLGAAQGYLHDPVFMDPRPKGEDDVQEKD